MERLLEGAVEHGVANIRDRLQAIGPTQLLVNDNARARGFRLDGYGVFFDVVVPSLDTTVLWSIRTLDQNLLGFQSALRELEAHIKESGDVNLEQALRRIELQVDPLLVARSATSATPAVPVAPPADPIFADPNEAYRAEVTRALMESLLDHSSSLGVEPSEWLTIAARRNEERPRLAPADTDAQTFFIRLRGSDLAAFLARQITREEALKRIDVRLFQNSAHARFSPWPDPRPGVCLARLRLRRAHHRSQARPPDRRRRHRLVRRGHRRRQE